MKKLWVISDHHVAFLSLAEAKQYQAEYNAQVNGFDPYSGWIDDSDIVEMRLILHKKE